MTTSIERQSVAIIGGGSIGVGWAIVFAVGGHHVRVFDSDMGRQADARREIRDRLLELEDFGLMSGTSREAAGRISFEDSIESAVDGAGHVQECISEELQAKKRLFTELDRIAPPDVVLASSSSFLPASSFAAGLPGHSRALVLHPANPPYLLRIAEIVPASFTDPHVVERTARFLEDLDMASVRLGGEIEGFAYNRLQGALLREAYCLVRDGILSVGDIDRLVRDALGLRWSVIGPFATADLNTRGGIEAHAKRMGPAYARMGKERGQQDPWTEDLVAEVIAARRKALPIERWLQRGNERDRALMSLLRARRRDPGLAICMDE